MLEYPSFHHVQVHLTPAITFDIAELVEHKSLSSSLFGHWLLLRWRTRWINNYYPFCYFLVMIGNRSLCMDPIHTSSFPYGHWHLFIRVWKYTWAFYPAAELGRNSTWEAHYSSRSGTPRLNMQHNCQSMLDISHSIQTVLYWTRTFESSVTWRVIYIYGRRHDLRKYTLNRCVIIKL